MNASYHWLREFTAFDLSPAALRDMLTARAATVEELVSVRDDLRDIVVGLVVEARPHPDSDHLSVTRVDAGKGELLDVVCGAPNVQAGVKYPFAPTGATLPGGLKIERRKIRGATSNGMLCSARELGLGDDHDGILALETDAGPGTPFLSVYEAGDTRLVIDVLPNRPDLLSHHGTAREIAAFTGAPIKVPRHGKPGPAHHAADGSGTTGQVGVTVLPDADCPLFTATIIKGVTVGPSPDWLASALRSIGLRSINNVVDVTNYMLHGFGQPMHVFDLGKLSGPALVVRKAARGEKIVSLDGVERSLDESMTVVADSERAQGIAGVIGGKGSEVSAATVDVLLEAATFDAASIRRTRRKLGVSTDASYRFERAVDASSTEQFARMAAGLIVEVAGGTIVDAPVRIGAPPSSRELTLRVARVARLLGESVPAAECTQLLRSVGFEISSADDMLTVRVPSWRNDVAIEADLIEEIARLRGYDSFSAELRPFRVGSASDSEEYKLTRRVTAALVSCGLLEARPIPFVAESENDVVRVINPLAESEAVLRSSILSTLDRRVEYNFAHMSRNVRLFEVGHVFTRGTGALPVESLHSGVVISGDREPAHFTDARPPQVDRWDAKWIAEQLAVAAYGASFELVPDGDGWNVVAAGISVGSVGLRAVDAPVWAPAVFGVEIDLTHALAAKPSLSRYRPLPAFPAADFDLALLLPDAVTAADVERVIRTTAGELLESVVPFDEFRGAGVPSGHRSVGWRLTLRHPERTLRDKEIEGRRSRILEVLDKELSVRPRTS